MAWFCASFAWCSPSIYWSLTLDEHRALSAVLAASAGKE